MTGPLYLHSSRRPKRMHTQAACLDILRAASWGVLGLCSPEGRAYAVPLNFALLDTEAGPALTALAATDASTPSPGAPDQAAPSSEDPSQAFRPGRFLLAFHCARQGLKLDLLPSTSEACFTVVPVAEPNPARLATRFECVMAYGPLLRLEPGATGHDDILRRFGQHFSAPYPDFLHEELTHTGPRTTVLALTVQGLTGKFNPGL